MSDTQRIWELAEAAVIAGDAETLGRLLREHEALFRDRSPQCSWSGGLAPDYSSGDAQAILVREHDFENWEALNRHLAARRDPGSLVARFEAAIDAIVAGDVAALEQLLQQTPALIRQRSPRTHRATLLIYTGANGVESWRQRTPKNAVQVTEVLLRAGAEIDAMGDMYGGSTTLGLVATSIHPLLAGVQNDLIDVLLAHGAAIDHPQAAGNCQGIVNGCLANGCPGAAQYLARRGARLDLEGAAGVGRLDVVRTFFREPGGLVAEATPAQMKSGFQWACGCGHREVVEFLLVRGIDAGESHRGQTGLHWAAYGGHAEIVRSLLKRSVPVNARDEQWGNTPLGWALYGWANPPPEPSNSAYHEVVELLVAAGATVEANRAALAKARADSRMSAALAGARLPG